VLAQDGGIVMINNCVIIACSAKVSSKAAPAMLPTAPYQPIGLWGTYVMGGWVSSVAFAIASIAQFGGAVSVLQSTLSVKNTQIFGCMATAVRARRGWGPWLASAWL
jgi:hypothetical protein